MAINQLFNCRCEYILQCKGVEFVKKIVAKFPNLRRPTLSNPRFNHRTGQLISVNPGSDQQQPIIVDPRENMNQSGGDVLRNTSPPSLVNGFQSGSEEIQRMAESMGFDKALIQQVTER